MLTAILSTIGLQGIIGAAVGAAVAGYAGIRLGRWRERAATASKIEAAERRIIKEIDDAGQKALARAIEARRRAERDWDAERLSDDDAG